jgi:hypothetical protein
MKKYKKGSLTLTILKDSPGKAKESNWLPAPDGPIYMVMRLDWPKTEQPSSDEAAMRSARKAASRLFHDKNLAASIGYPIIKLPYSDLRSFQMKFRIRLDGFAPLVYLVCLKRLTSVLLAAAFVIVSWPAAAADIMSTDDMLELRGEVQADRSVAVAKYMQLTDADNKKFWPVYNAYMDQVERLNRKFLDLIQSYVSSQQNETLTDDMAKQMTDDFLAAQGEEIKLRTSYAANLAKVLPGKTVARAVQLENKIRAIAWYGIASRVPLVKQ